MRTCKVFTFEVEVCITSIHPIQLSSLVELATIYPPKSLYAFKPVVSYHPTINSNYAALMFKILNFPCHLRDALDAEYARDRDLSDRLVLLSDELSVPVDVSVIYSVSLNGEQLTARVVRVVRAAIARAALIVFPVTSPLQTEDQCQTA
jgi:hypothetical protein